MAFDLGGIFTQQTQPHTPLWPPIGPPYPGQLNGLGLMAANPAAAAALNGAAGLYGPPHAAPPTPAGHPLVAPPPPIEIPQPKAEIIQGTGTLTWLSAKAGLITCHNNTKMVISFQIKDFCDQQLTDLTSVLRVGFTLGFSAALNETNEYTATQVSPIFGPEAEHEFVNAQEVDLEKANPTPPNSKDAYSPALETKAIPALLNIFQRHGLTQIQLSSLHSQMSNCGDEELFRYVGTSSLKRRQFVERRTHIFRLTQDDAIALQNSAVYICVCRLASFLLRRGGATSIEALWEYFTSAEMPIEIRECLGIVTESRGMAARNEFLNLIQSHPWVFALFPNRVFVSVRRNLPHYDYPGFIKKNFPDLDVMRVAAQRYPMRAQLARSFSTHGGSMMAMPPQQQQQSRHLMQGTQRPVSLWDNQPPLTQTTPSPSIDPWYFNNTPWANSPLERAVLDGTPTSMMPMSMGNSLFPKNMVSTATQTDEMKCICGCQCQQQPASIFSGVPSAQARRHTAGDPSIGSAGSVSPPSMDSVSPSGDCLSPPGTGISNGIGSAPEPIRYYDPFGTDILAAGARLSSLRI
ncbi:hypothetical protein WR25_13743 [Diploscapter pachys]|uniref:Lin-66-like winged helix domain-containing protein n=1 Tax=Diploscapter pachys TaxID=2018661 RepID=A0A2A2L6Q5_9BILA|nr:hypothetical protein WR25_13743 [Diploscapter pachys]